jgi:SHS2 domain-containing protein
MKKFENLEHTADLKLRAFGQTKEDLFANMAIGMFANICPEANKLKNQPVEMTIKIKAHDLSSLLIDFLNELLYLSDINNQIYDRYDLAILQLPDKTWLVEGVAYGYNISGLDYEIKAVTYNDLKVEEDSQGNWLAEVVIDI